MSPKRLDSLFQRAPGPSGFVEGLVGALGTLGNISNELCHETEPHEAHSWPQMFQALCELQLSLTTVGRGVGMQLS